MAEDLAEEIRDALAEMVFGFGRIETD